MADSDLPRSRRFESVLGGVGLLAVLVVLVRFFLTSAAETEAFLCYLIAMKNAGLSKDASDALGAPIEAPEYQRTFAVEIEHPTVARFGVRVTFSVPVCGPKANGRIDAVVRREGSVNHVESESLTVEGKTIPLKCWVWRPGPKGSVPSER